MFHTQAIVLDGKNLYGTFLSNLTKGLESAMSRKSAEARCTDLSTTCVDKSEFSFGPDTYAMFINRRPAMPHNCLNGCAGTAAP
jgi:hypothetical protein